MRLSWAATWMVGLALVGCASSPKQPSPAPPPPTTDDADADAGPGEEPAPVSTAPVDAPERTRPPSTATYEQAMSTPERLDVEDDRAHLTDAQLRGPMRSVPSRCRLPANAKVTIKTAVQNGRAIGVTVDVRFEHARPAKPPKRPTRAQATAAAAAAKREAKAVKEIARCFDHVVREIVWPPNNRRDSFTTEF